MRAVPPSSSRVAFPSSATLPFYGSFLPSTPPSPGFLFLSEHVRRAEGLGVMGLTGAAGPGSSPVLGMHLGAEPHTDNLPNSRQRDRSAQAQGGDNRSSPQCIKATTTWSPHLGHSLPEASKVPILPSRKVCLIALAGLGSSPCSEVSSFQNHRTYVPRIPQIGSSLGQGLGLLFLRDAPSLGTLSLCLAE